MSESAPAARIPVTSAAVVLASTATIVPRPSAETCSSAACATDSRTFSASRRASLGRVVVLDGRAGRLADALEQAGAIVGEAVGDASRGVRARGLSLREQRHHVLPLPQLPFDQEVDDAVHAQLHLVGQPGHRLRLEVAPEPIAVEELAEAAEAQPLVEEGVAAPLELEEHLLDVRQPEAEVADELGRPPRHARLDRVEGREVALEHREPLGDEGLRLAEGPARDAERALELEAEALRLVERRHDLGLRRREGRSRRGPARRPARAPRAPGARRRPAPRARAPSVRPACSRTNATTFASFSCVFSRSALLSTMTIFLPHCRIASRKARSLSV